MADKGYLEKLYKGRPVRILIMGPTGAGKSSTGNTILGEETFHSNMASHSVTRRATYRSKERFGRVVSIVDTPGVCDTTMTDIEFQNAILESYLMCSPGPHALLIVLNLSFRYSDECKKTIDFIKWHLTQQVFKHAIIVFTHEDDLIHHRKNVQQYLNTATKDLSELLNMCNQRYVPFNNRNQGEEQVKRLFDLIDKTVEMNKGHYTNKLFENLEKGIQSKIDQRVKTLMAKKADPRIKQQYDDDVEEKTQSINDAFLKEVDPLKLREELIKKLEEGDMVAKNDTGRKVLNVLKSIGIGTGVFLGGVVAVPFVLVGGVLAAILTPIIAVILKIEFDD